MTMTSISLPFRPASETSFPFQDLPGEIRNKIYGIVLHDDQLPTENNTGFVDVPDEITFLHPKIETNILRTCHSMYLEGKDVLLRSNLFVKVVVRIWWQKIKGLLISKKIPILTLTRGQADNFKYFVMTHEITQPDKIEGRTFAILYRDLYRFCSAVEDAKWGIPNHDATISHTVTLIDPYHGDTLVKTPTPPPFFSQKLQEKLIAPYRVLRGFQRFQIEGDIPEDLAATAMAEISQFPADDPDAVIRSLEKLKAEGTEYFKAKNTSMASEKWATALIRIRRLLAGLAGEALKQAGGITFINKMAELIFTLHSNLALNNLRAMRQQVNDQDLVHGLSNGLFHSIEEARGFTAVLPDATWAPTDHQLGKLTYREAVAARLTGNTMRARMAIEVASRKIPGDAEIAAEKGRIARMGR